MGSRPENEYLLGLALDDIHNLVGDRRGIIDVPCPECGPGRHTPLNRKRPVLRVWYTEPAFVTYCCSRCGLAGYARDGKSKPPAPERLAAVRAATDKRDKESRADRLQTARFLLSRRQPPANTLVDRFLRQARGYHGPIPSTISFLPGSDKHAPAMIAALGIPDEPEPGLLDLRLEAVTGVHLTPLLADGSGKASKAILIGNSLGSPLVLAPMNDLLGLIVCEGLETGLSLHEATGCGVWASCGASRMPALAAAMPNYTDTVMLAGEPDDGLRHAEELVRRVTARGLYAELRVLTEPKARP